MLFTSDLSTHTQKNGALRTLFALDFKREPIFRLLLWLLALGLGLADHPAARGAGAGAGGERAAAAALYVTNSNISCFVSLHQALCESAVESKAAFRFFGCLAVGCWLRSPEARNPAASGRGIASPISEIRGFR
jgi:hypothetical protein